MYVVEQRDAKLHLVAYPREVVFRGAIEGVDSSKCGEDGAVEEPTSRIVEEPEETTVRSVSVSK